MKKMGLIASVCIVAVIVLFYLFVLVSAWI